MSQFIIICVHNEVFMVLWHVIEGHFRSNWNEIGFLRVQMINLKIWYRNNWLQNDIFLKVFEKIIFPWKFLSRVPNFITGSLYNISIDYRLLLIQVQFQFKIILKLFKINSRWCPLSRFYFQGFESWPMDFEWNKK